MVLSQPQLCHDRPWLGSKGESPSALCFVACHICGLPPSSERRLEDFPLRDSENLYNIEDGTPYWTGGDHPTSYSGDP